MTVKPSPRKIPAHGQRRHYVTPGVREGLQAEKLLPEKTWESVKRAVGIPEGEKFVPAVRRR